MKKRIRSIILLLLVCISFSISPNIAIARDAYENGEKIVSILHINDTHSRIKNSEETWGYAKFNTYAKYIEDEQGVRPILLDAGDSTHGQVFSTFSGGESIILIMNSMGFDAMVPGNHDFNYGYERLIELSKEAEFSIISSNVMYEDGSLIFSPYEIVERDGVKVGIFGLCTPETKYKTNPGNVQGIIFSDCIKAAKNMVEELEPKVDVIICLGHIGLDISSVITSDIICQNVDGIDIFVDGHSHTALKEGLKVNNSLIVSMGQYMNNIGQVTIILDKDNNIKDIQAKLIPKEQDINFEEDESIESIINNIQNEQSVLLNEIVGNVDVLLDGSREKVRSSSTNLTKLLCDAMRYETGAEIAIVNGGTVRDSLGPGDITRADIIDVLPFGNYLITKSVSGKLIKQALEEGVSQYPELQGAFPDVSGMEYKFDPNRPKGEKIVSMKIDGKDMDMEKEYIVAMSDYIASGGDEYPFSDIPDLKEFGCVDETLLKYLKTSPQIPEANDLLEVSKRVRLKLDDTIDIYSVLRGDTLIKIADKYNVDIQEIEKINNIKDPESIYENQILFIPVV